MSKKLYLFMCLSWSALMISACSNGPTSLYHSPWDISQPAQNSQTGQNETAEVLQPQIDWRDQHNIQRHVGQSDLVPPASNSLKVIDVEQRLETPNQGGVISSRHTLPTQPQHAQGPKVKVAFLAPLSGTHKEIGQALLNAAQLALFDVGHDNFEIIPRDTKGTPLGAQQAARSVVQENVDLILGPLLSDSVRAVKSTVSSSDTPIIAFSTDWKVAGGQTYIMGFLPFAQVARVTNYALYQGYDQMAFLAPQNEYTSLVSRTLSYTLKRQNTALVKARTYSALQNETDIVIAEFTEFERRKAEMDLIKQDLQERIDLALPHKDLDAERELKSLQRRKATSDLTFNALMIPIGGQGLKTLSTYLGHYEIDTDTVKLIGTGLWDDITLTKEPILKGGWFAAPDPDLRQDFLENYTQTYGEKPPRLATLGYDATALAAILAQTGHGLTAEQVYNRTRLVSERGFAGIDGIFRFRPDGLVERGLAVLEVRPNGLYVIDPAPTAFLSAKRS